MRLLLILTIILTNWSCQKKETIEVNLKDISYEAFIYAYPLMEQVKTLNGMFEFLNMKANIPAMNAKFPMDNVGQPIVAPNLTSMTGGIFIDISGGPVTLEIPEVKDRYIVYQFIDVFTHNFYYLGSRANQGNAGQFIFHNKSQGVPESSKATPVLVEGDHALMVNRIDIKDRSELELVRSIQSNIKVINAPTTSHNYPKYDRNKAYSPDFVDYLNELLTEVPESEIDLFKIFENIGVFNEVDLTEVELDQVQAGIDSAFASINKETNNLMVGNNWFGATEVFGTREYLNENYIGRASGAHFGLWGNSKEEANYFMLKTDGEGEIKFTADQLPPLSDIGFWSITVHDENVHVYKNKYDSYVLTMDQMGFEEDGSLVLKISSSPQDGNWLYTPGEKMVILIRAYQADPNKIGDYVPPAFDRLK